MVFKIGSETSGDYSNRVIAGSYDVNNDPVFESWFDSNKVEHKNRIRDRIVGSFDMFFRSMTEYDAFVSLVKTSKLADESVFCTVAVNNDTSPYTGYFFIKFAPKRDIAGDWSDYMQRFTVEITER